MFDFCALNQWNVFTLTGVVCLLSMLDGWGHDIARWYIERKLGFIRFPKEQKWEDMKAEFVTHQVVMALRKSGTRIRIRNSESSRHGEIQQEWYIVRRSAPALTINTSLLLPHLLVAINRSDSRVCVYVHVECEAILSPVFSHLRWKGCEVNVKPLADEG